MSGNKKNEIFDEGPKEKKLKEDKKDNNSDKVSLVIPFDGIYGREFFDYLKKKKQNEETFLKEKKEKEKKEKKVRFAL